MPLNLHQRNRSPIPDWDFPARYPPPNVHRRYHDRDHERIVPRCTHGGHHVNHAYHHANGYAPPPSVHTPPIDRYGRRLAIVRHRTASPTDASGCNRWHWRWLCPCLRTCRCAHSRGPRQRITRSRARDLEREEAYPYPFVPGHDSGPDDTCCHPSPTTDGWQRQRHRGGGREGGRVRVRVRGPGPELRGLPKFKEKAREQLLSPPPPPLYQGRPRIPRERRGRNEDGEPGMCTCPDCTGEAPDLIDQLCGGVDALGFVDGGRRNAVADGIHPPPNSRLSSRSRSSRYERAPPRPSRARSRSRRPYRRTARDGERELEDPSFLGLLDTGSGVAGGDNPEFNVIGTRRTGGERRRGRMRGGGRVGGSLGELSMGRADEMADESDLEAWDRGFDGRMTW